MAVRLEDIKREKKKKKAVRKFNVILILLAAAAGAVVFFATRPSKEQTGKEWFAKQQEYIDSLQIIIDDTDSVVALYLDGDIEKNDVFNHIAIFKQEMVILKYDYNRYYKEHPLKIGSSEYYETKGIEAAQKCFSLYEELLGTMESVYDDKDKLAYIYLAYQQRFNESVTVYSYCKDVVFGESQGDGDAEESYIGETTK